MKKKEEKEKERRQQVAKVYFEYWQLQNNKSYLKFYDQFIKRGGKRDGETIESSFKYGLLFPVDPYKKIDWNQIFVNGYDHSIIKEYVEQRFQVEKCPVKIRIGTRTHSPEDLHVMTLIVDVGCEKKEYLRRAEKAFDEYRRMIKFKPFNRHHWEKVPSYCQTFDLIMGPPIKTLKEVGRMLNQNLYTIFSRFKKANELLTGKPYQGKSLEFFEMRIKMCDTCKEKICLKTKKICKEMETVFFLREGKQWKDRPWTDKTIAFQDYDIYKKWLEAKPLESEDEIEDDT